MPDEDLGVFRSLSEPLGLSFVIPALRREYSGAQRCRNVSVENKLNPGADRDL